MSGTKGVRILKWLLASAAIVALLISGVVYILLYRIDQLIDVEGRLAEAISEATDGLYRMEVDTVIFEADGNRIYAENLRIWPDMDPWEADGKPPPFYRYEIILPVIEIKGLAELTMLMRRALVADSLYLGRPQVHIFSLPSDSSLQVQDEEEDLPFRIHARIGERLDGVQLNTLTIEQALLSYTREGRDTVLWSDSLRGFDVRFQNLAVEEDRADDTDHVLFSEDIEAVIAPHTRWFADSLYTLTLGEITISAREGIMRVDSVAFSPTVSDVQLNLRRGYRKGRYKIEIGQLDLHKLGFRDLIENERIGVGGIELDGFLIDYADDHRFPGRRPRPKPMPHDLIQQIGLPLHIDSLRVRRARVMYSRYAPDGVRPGRLPFTDVAAVFYNISSDSTRMSGETPALARAEGRIAGAGRLQVDMEYNLLSPTFDLAYRGGLEPMNLTRLNSMLEPGVGIKLRAGQLQRLSFDIQARNGRSRGRVDTRYRDLSVQLVNPDGTRRSLGKQFKSFIANQFVIWSANPIEGEPLRTGTVSYVHEPTEPFFRFLWKSLSTGLVDVTGMR